MSAANVDIIRYIYDSFDSGDLNGPLVYFSPDVEGYVSDFVPWGGAFKGFEGMKRGLQVLRTYVVDTFEADELIDAGDYVVAVGHSVGYIQETGTTYTARSVHLWHLRDGKIVSLTNHLDANSALSRLKGSEALREVS
jgi:uncharacterized protein